MIYETAKVTSKIINSKLENYTIGDFVLATVPKLYLGAYCQINAHSVITGRSSVRIGRHAVIGYDVTILSSSDTVAERMDDASPENKRKIINDHVVIGNYAYVGSHSILMPGVNIGDYAVIGAHSYVPSMTWVKPYTVSWGQPIKTRLTRQVTER